MNHIHATLVDGTIVPDSPPQWPNGTRLVIGTIPVAPLTTMTENEQGDDPESISRWLAAFDAIPIAKSSPFDEPEVVAWRETMRKYNIEAMRKQMMEAPE